MTELKIYCLYSGSGGNCLYLESEGARVLIDAGKSARTLTASLADIGVSPCDIDGIFITHEHRDHVSALEVLLKHHKIPVHIVGASARKLIFGGLSCYEDVICIHPPVFTFEIGDMKIRSFPTRR